MDPSAGIRKLAMGALAVSTVSPAVAPQHMENLGMLKKHLHVPRLVRLPAVFLIFLFAATGARAQQQSTGVPGSASATTTTGGKQLPPPPPKFGGAIKGERQRFQALVATAHRAA
jgi:hypothetical protein